jgi:hypothetical protein
MVLLMKGLDNGLAKYRDSMLSPRALNIRPMKLKLPVDEAFGTVQD